MGFAGDKQSKDADPVQRLAAPGASAGKQTLVGQIDAPVQRHATAGAAVSDGQVHQAAAQGTATPSTSLPHLAAIQQSFGRHDVSGVQAHTGGAASASAQAMGAGAYATGNHVVLGQSDLHTVAHEAAHVVQQRGGVQLKGGVGDAGDTYEQHADQVADAVVSGKSAESLLDRHAPSGGKAADRSADKPAVQGYMRITRADFAARNVADNHASFSGQEPPNPGGSYLRDDGTTNIVRQTIATVGAIRVSADGRLAIEDKEDGSERQAKTFFIEAGLIALSNAELVKAKSAYQLVQQGGTLNVPDRDHTMHQLVQVVAQHKSGARGDDVTGPVNCDEMAAQVGGWNADHNKEARLKRPVPDWKNEEGHRVAAYVVEFAKKSGLKDKIRGRGRGTRAGEASDYAAPAGRNPAEILAALAPQRDAIAQAYGQMNPVDKAAVAEELGINEGAQPKVGEAMVTFSTGAKNAGGAVRDHESNTDVNARWGQHWGGVVARSGGDYITLENYDRKGEDEGHGAAPVAETRAFFQMYGNGPAQSWHAAQKATGEFPNAVSMPYGNRNADKT